ncbi:hypothetical protein SeMB42_g02124 [Synchytrium endobioticum]|uniref:Cas1p 10 TM acyl transferase domain-containing protein n=1 Tax=Synchytrium endobioticum TaxID=286115 RepID=A0A507DHL3_9FUNG|nr:hypothetical protein SeMB42_g02124 [Synchytrium endobioticum]
MGKDWHSEQHFLTVIAADADGGSVSTHASSSKIRPPPPTVTKGAADIWTIAARICIAVTFISALTAWLHHGISSDCNGVLQATGRWIRPPTTTTNGLGYQLPYCTLHEYSSSEALQCLGTQTGVIRIRIHGDSSARNLYYGLLHILSPDRPSIVEYKAHTSMVTQLPRHTELHFLYDPFMNGSDIDLDLSDNPHVPVSMLVMSFGTWYLRYGGASGHDDSVNKAGSILARLITGRNGTPAAPVSYLLPVSPVIDTLLSSERRQTLTNPRIQHLNNEMAHVADVAHLLKGADDAAAGIYVKAFEYMYSQASGASTDGLHYDLPVSKMASQILLNHRCNAQTLQVIQHHIPPSATCCRNYKSPEPGQWIMIMILVTLALLAPVTKYVTPLSRFSTPNTAAIIQAVSELSVVLLFTYMADRSWLLGKAAKQYSDWRLIIMLCISFIIGMMTLQTTPNDEVLNRHQTDEWKGWMQIVILFYHYLGGSQVLWLYIIVRVLVASYIFMTGVGHAQFFYAKQDFSGLKVLKVLVRLNLLPVLLSLTMGSPYIGYYFSPLVSIWFLVVYLIFWVGHDYSTSSHFIIFKVASASVITRLLIAFPTIIDAPFSLLQSWGLGQGWSANEWRFRLYLDSYICYAGVMAGFLLGRFKKVSIHPSMAIGATIVSVAAFLSMGYVIYAEQKSLDDGTPLSKVKVNYNDIHVGYSVIPVLAYCILRNVTSKLRKTYSAFFAWFGRISLETFIMQFHIFLAADTKSTLVVLPNTSNSWVWWLNFVVVCVVFLFACVRVASASRVLAEWLLGSNGGWKVTTILLAVVVVIYARF